MDNRTFDDLTRKLGGTTTRRGVARVLGGGLIGGAFALLARKETDAYVCRAGGILCLTDEQGCSNFCDSVTHRCGLAVSDRAAKANFAPVDAQAVLARVTALPIQTWNYRADDPAVRHLGPMAQDFAAAFGVGADDRHIHVVDGQGVALSAIQGLSQLLAEQQATSDRLATRVAELEAR